MTPRNATLLLCVLAGCSGSNNTSPDGGAVSDAMAAIDASSVDAMPLVDGAPSGSPFVINEVYKNPPTSDDDFEFIEVFGTPNADLSTLRIVLVESDLPEVVEDDSIGVVDAIYTLTETDEDGIAMVGFFADEIGNGSTTFLLVDGATAGLQVGVDLDTNDDGVLDTTPWAQLYDDVALVDDDGDVAYSTTALTNNADGMNDEYVGAARIPDGMDTGAITDWVRANEVGEGLQGQNGASGNPCLPEDCTLDAPVGTAIITPHEANRVKQ